MGSKMKAVAYLLGIFLLVATGSGITNAAMPTQLEDCAAMKTTADRRVCLGQVLSHAEADLARKYADVQAQIADSGFSDELSKTQETWTLYVRQTCDDLVFPLNKDGSIQVPAYLSCKIELTRARIHDLDQMFQYW